MIDPDNSGTHDIFDITYSLDHSTSLYTWDMHLYSPYNASHPTPAGILELNNIGDSLRLVTNNDIPPQINSQYNLAVTNHHRVLYPPVYCPRYQRMADSLNVDFHLDTQRAIAIENAVAAEFTFAYGHCTAHQMVFRPNIMVEHPGWSCIGVSYAQRMNAAHHFPKLWYSWNELYEGVPGIKENSAFKPMKQSVMLGSTIIKGPIHLPDGMKYKILDIAGREIHTLNPAPGIYFIGINDHIVQKVVKVR